MNKEQVDKINIKLKEKWGNLTSEDIALYSTKREQFLGKLKERYSLSKEDAEKHLKIVEESCGCGSSKAA